jgi:type I restriction enzyme, S subunit
MSDPFLAKETPSGWSSSVLGEVATLQRGYDLPIQNRMDGYHPVYGSNGIDGFNDKAMLPGPGVITGRSGTIGLVHFVESAYWPLNTTLYVKHFHGNDERYIYYFLQTLNLGRFVAATGVPSLNRNFVHTLLVVIPPRPEQRKIARILTTLDNLIEKTESLIAKYQAIKQGMMHDVFTRGVDAHGHLRPHHSEAPGLYQQSVLGWIPDTWNVRPLGEVAEVGGGVTLVGNCPAVR